MGQAIENVSRRRLSHLPYIVRVPVPQQAASWTIETMHYWAAEHSAGGYAASPLRDYSDPEHPWGALTWHFRSVEAACKFAEQFSGTLVPSR